MCEVEDLARVPGLTYLLFVCFCFPLFVFWFLLSAFLLSTFCFLTFCFFAFCFLLSAFCFLLFLLSGFLFSTFFLLSDFLFSAFLLSIYFYLRLAGPVCLLLFALGRLAVPVCLGWPFVSFAFWLLVLCSVSLFFSSMALAQIEKKIDQKLMKNWSGPIFDQCFLNLGKN